MAVSVPCSPHLQLPAGRGRCPVRQNPLLLGPGSLPARRRAPQKLSGLRSRTGTSSGGPHFPWVANWVGRVVLPGIPVPAGPFGPPSLCCAALSWVVVRASSRACSSSREGPAGEQSMVTDGTPSGMENCWGACPVGMERGCSWHAGHPSGCGGLWKTWECVVSVSSRAGLPWAPSPGQANTGTKARTAPASLGRPRGLYSSSALIFHIVLYHPVCQTGCLP